MRARSTPLRIAALAALLAATPGCRSARDRADPMEQPFRKVTPPVAFEMLRDAPYLAIVDLREADAYRGPQGHVNGARNLPLSELRERVRDLADLRGRTFLVYCQRDECNGEAMEFLLAQGFVDAVLMDGGIEAWLRDGFGTVEASGEGARGAERRRRSSTRHRAEAEPPPPP